MWWSSLPFIGAALYLHFIRRLRTYVLLFVLFIGIVPLSLLLLPPASFPRDAYLVIPEQASFTETTRLLYEKNLISHPLLFKVLARFSGTDTHLQAGRYAFSHPIGMLEVLCRLGNGVSGIETVRITVPEGSTVRDIARIVHDALPAFDAEKFIRVATPQEGYLFPETYEVYTDVTPEELVARMKAQFTKEWDAISADATTTESMERIVIMASILEKETKQDEDRRMVSGILWKRIALHMPLQVDAVFGYIHNRDTYHPSLEDLEIDSPYNTYRYKGLPPGPISNPGKDALFAARNPKASPYLYYLTGKDGKEYYARTFEEHKANKLQYLR